MENKQVPKDVDAPRFAPNAQLDYTLPLCMEVQLLSTTLELRNVVSEVSKNLLLYYGMKSYSSHSRDIYIYISTGVEGKYCLHFHKLHDCPTCSFKNNAIEGSHQRGMYI